MATKAAPTKAVDLGKLQDIAETATRTLKAASTILAKAIESKEKAEADYHTAQKALSTGVEHIRSALKVN